MTSRGLLTHPLVLEVAGKLLHQATSFQVRLTQIISIGPNSPSQPIHRDEWAFDFFDFPSDVHPQCNTIWAMTDFTEANGATRVIPGSQERPVDLAHSADATRTGLNLTYYASWLRQEENQYLSCPLEVAQKLDDDLLKLMGYQLGAYALGYVDDVRSPLDAIRGTVGATGFRA
jgi:ectoine hydroxylase-related dioxygenase (phytanoyl-CoA dioxygenase family)